MIRTFFLCWLGKCHTIAPLSLVQMARAFRTRPLVDFSLFHLPTYREGFSANLNAFFEELIESVRLADRLGWARALTTEHHFHYYGGAVPNPAVILAAWARETR